MDARIKDAAENAAHGHLIAVALAIASRDRQDPKTDLDVVLQSLIQQFAATAGEVVPAGPLRNEFVSAYADEVAQVKKMTLGMLKAMGRDQ